MVFKFNRNIVYSKSLADISVKAFDAALKGNLRTLVKGYRFLYFFIIPYQPKNVPEKVRLAWESMYKKYTDRTSDSDELTIYLIQGELAGLRLRLKMASALINALRTGRPQQDEEAFLKGLDGWDLVANRDKDLAGEIDRLEKALNNSKNKIGRLSDELEELTKGDKERAEKLTLNHLKIKAQLSTKIDIDLDTTSMDEWLIIWDEIGQIAERTKKAQKPRKDEQ